MAQEPKPEELHEDWTAMDAFDKLKYLGRKSRGDAYTTIDGVERYFESFASGIPPGYTVSDTWAIPVKINNITDATMHISQIYTLYRSKMGKLLPIEPITWTIDLVCGGIPLPGNQYGFVIFIDSSQGVTVPEPELQVPCMFAFTGENMLCRLRFKGGTEFVVESVANNNIPTYTTGSGTDTQTKFDFYLHTTFQAPYNAFQYHPE